MINCVSQTEIDEGFHQILSSINNPILERETQSLSEIDASALCSLVVNHIKSLTKPWFLILENAGNGSLVAHNFKGLLGATHGGALAIITCDEQIEKALPTIELLWLGPLPVNFAVQLLQSRIVRLTKKEVTDAKDSLETLVQELGYLPAEIMLVAEDLCGNLRFSNESFASRVEEYRQSYKESDNLNATTVLEPRWRMRIDLLGQPGVYGANNDVHLLY